MQTPTVDRQIAGGVACAFLLFVAGVVFFVDHDELQVRHGREDGHACAQHDTSMARMRGQPAFQALGRCHAAVHGHHRLRSKTGLHTLFELGREVDLGHHDEGLGLRVGRQHAFHGLQIHLGLAAAGAAKQQKRPIACGHLVQHGALFWREGRAGRGLHRTLSVLFFQATRQLFGAQVAQLRRQGRQGHFAQRALVILGREQHQLPPGVTQRGQILQHAGDIAHR